MRLSSLWMDDITKATMAIILGKYLIWQLQHINIGPASVACFFLACNRWKQGGYVCTGMLDVNHSHGLIIPALERENKKIHSSPPCLAVAVLWGLRQMLLKVLHLQINTKPNQQIILVPDKLPVWHRICGALLLIWVNMLIISTDFS